MEAYCVKCKAKKEMQNATAITMKNGKPATQSRAGRAAPRCSRSESSTAPHKQVVSRYP